MKLQDTILSNKTYKDYKKISRYSVFPYYYNRLDDKYLYIRTANLINTTPATLYTTKKKETCDSLALKFYGNPTLYWIIADYNRILDPYITFDEGSTIWIPNYSNIIFDTQ